MKSLVASNPLLIIGIRRFLILNTIIELNICVRSFKLIMKKYAVEHTMQMAIDITKKIQALGKDAPIDLGVPLLSIPVYSSQGL